MLEFVALYPQDVDNLASLDRCQSSSKIYCDFAFHRNYRTNIVYPTSFAEIARRMSMPESAVVYGYRSLVKHRLFVPYPHYCSVYGKLIIEQQGEDTMTKQFIPLSPEDTAKIVNMEHITSAFRVFRVITFEYTTLETGRVRFIPIKQIAEKAGIPMSSAYKGYKALVKAKLFDPDPEWRPICGRLLLSCFPKPKEETGRSKQLTPEKRYNKVVSIADVLKEYANA